MLSNRCRTIWTIGIVAGLALALLAQSARAAVVTWDTSSGTGFQSGPGSWSSTDSFWSTTGGTILSGWVGGNDAVFANSGGTDGATPSAVTVSGTQSVGNITFSNTGYSISGGALTLVASAVSLTSTVADPTISTSITGGTLTKLGAGTVTLTGSNSISDLRLNAGTLGLANANALQPGAPIIRFGGGALQFSASNTVDPTTYAVIGPSTGAIALDTNGQNVSIGGALGSSNTGGLAKIGGGILSLTAANLYTGTTTISAGTLALGAGASLATAGSLNFSGNGTFNLGANSQTLANMAVANGFTGSVTGSGGTLTTTAGTLTVGSATAGSAQTLNLSGLGTYVYNNSAGTWNVGGALAATAVGASGTLFLATTNSVTAAVVNAGVAGGGAATPTGTRNTSLIYLGQSNTINAGAINVGYNNTIGSIQFASGLTTPTLTIAGSAGPTSRAGVTIAQCNSNPGAVGVFDLVSGVSGASTLNASIGTLAIGVWNRTSAATSVCNSMGSFLMGGGTLDATAIIVGQDSTGFGAATNSSVSGSFTLGDSAGTVLVQRLTVGFQTSPSTTTMPVTGVVNLNNGTLSAGTINSVNTSTGVVNSTFNWNNGTIANYNPSYGLGGDSAVSGLSVSIATMTLAATGSHTFWIDGGQSGTVSSQLTETGGSASLIKAGAGLLSLTANNGYSGSTTVNGGTLQLGNGGSLNPAGLIAVNSGATLAFNRGDTPTQGFDFSASGISGAGGLAQIGTGTLILNASNTYSGPTTVSAGALQVDGAIAQTSAIAVGTAGTLAGAGLIGGNTAPTNITGGAAVNLSGGTIGGPLNATGGNWTGMGTVNGLVTASSNVFTVANGSLLTAAANMNLSGGTLTGQGTISGGTLTLGGGALIAPGNTANTNNIGTLTLPSLATAGGGTLSLDLSNVNTVGGGVNDLIQVAGNVSLGGTTTLSIYSTAVSLATGSPYTLFTYAGNLSRSGTLALAPGSIGGRQTASFNYGSGNNSEVTMTLSGSVANLTWVGTSSTTWVNNTGIKPWTSPTSPSGDFFASGDLVTFDNTASATSITLSGTLLPGSINVTGTNSFTFSGGGTIGGITGLTLAGPGSLTIANSGNNYIGPTLVQGGTLAAGANNALSPASALVLGSGAGNGTVDLAGFSQKVASLGTDPSAVTANQTIGNSAASTTATLTINGSSTYGGTIQDGLNGSGGQTALTVAGGLVNLGGSNTYSGPTTIASGGTLQLASYTALGAGANAGNLVANGLLDLLGNPATVGAISGSGTVADSYGFATLNFGSAANSTFSGLFQSLYLSQTGAGTFVLTGANSAASTTINQGTFQVGNGSANGNAGSSQYSIASGARLYVNQGANPSLTFTWGNFSGGGTIELNDALTVSTSAAQYSSMNSTNALSNFTGTVQLDHQGFVTVNQTGLGGTTNVVINQGAQMVANDGTTNAETFPQNFSIAGMGSLSGSNFGALGVVGMNANFTGNITLTGDAGLYMTNATGSMMNVSGSISGNYGLTINDANLSNPIILSGSNDYSGPTSVASGTLAVNGALAPSGSVTVAGGATLSGSGSVGATAVNTGGKILGGYNNIGSLTLATLTFAGSANVFGALGNSTTSPAPIIVNGALTTSAGTILVNLTGTLPTVGGTYPFLQYGSLGGSGSAAFQMAATTRDYSLTNVTGATNYLGVTYIAGLYPIWTGSNSTAFVGGTNWKLSTDGSPTDYINLDQVVFDDSATSTTVNVNQSVTPFSTTFNNSTLSYTLTGAFGIGGAGSLTKNGTAGLLTIANTNSYTGGTFINGGTLAANSIGNSGVASALGAGTAITLNGGVLAITNNTAGNGAMTTNRTIALGANGGSMAIVGTSTGGFTSNGAISGSNALTLTGTGLFTIPVYNNAFTGGFIVNAGTLAFGNTNNLVNQSYLGSGPLVVNSGAVAFADNVNSLGYTNSNPLGVYGAVVSSVTLNGGTLVGGDNNSVSKERLPNTTMTGAAIVPLGLGTNSEFDPADTSGTMSFTINPSTTTSTISVAFLGLLSNVNFNVSQGSTASGVDLLVSSSLIFYNNVSSITKSGPGEMVLSGTSSYTGGTNVNDGTLIVTNSGGIADGTSLNVGDPSLLSLLPAPIIPPQGSPSAAAVTPVPEPGTLGLIAAAALTGIGFLRKKGG